MLAICSGNGYILVLGRVIQYSSGQGIFSSRVSPRMTISHSNIGGVVVGGRLGRSAAVVSAAPPPTSLMRTHHTHGEYQSHAKDLLFYLISYTKVGLLISFRGCLGLLVCC